MKSIVFTSSITSEGKSLLVSTYAIYLSQLGRKVLLIDGDLRKPRLHTLFNLKLEKGFSDLLADEGSNLANTISKISDIDNLDFISAGSSLTEPTILFSSPRLQVLIDSIHESSVYDYILIDTPPSLICSDASLITKCCSTSIYIISLRNVKKDIAIEAVNDFTGSNANCLGVISNSIKPELNSVDSYSKLYSSYYSKSSMFISSNTKYDQESPDFSASSLNRLIHRTSRILIVKRTINLSVRMMNELRKWFID